jgi:hypothetical protein
MYNKSYLKSYLKSYQFFVLQNGPKAISGPTSNGAMTFFMVARTSSLDILVLETIKRLVDPTRSLGEFALNLQVVN